MNSTPGLFTQILSHFQCSDFIQHAQEFKAEREKLGWSREKLAEKADLARNYIGNVERAEYKITVETLVKIAKAMNLTVHDLTRGF